MLFLRKKEPEHLKTGRWGEKIAEQMLCKKGYKVLGRRVRMGKHGEIDLVVCNDTELLFIEVKTRKNADFGRPAEAVDRAKEQTLCDAVARYLARLESKPPSFRIDVVEVVGHPGDKNPEIKHIQSAIMLSEHYQIQW
ncbi:MAG: YraN family protein [Spartobacteria bacterium]|nr:YraN family protein [Spartobacteria bacterium]